MANFVKVASKSDLNPGESKLLEINGRAIALFNVGGELFALDNSCVHRGGPLCEGYVDPVNLTVQCPWHGWIYSLATGVSPINSMAKVERFEVHVEGNDIELSLD